MKRTLHLHIAAALALVTLSGCHHEHNELKHDHAHEHEGAEAEHHDGDEHGGEILLDDHRAEEFGVTVTPLEPRDFASVLEVAGQIAPLPSDEAAVTARTAGIVRLAAGATPGASVSAGQRIASVSAKGMAQGYAPEGARVAVEAARRELERLTPLAKDGIVTQRDFNAARARYEEAVAAANAAGGQAASAATAPVAGTLTSVLVTEGQFVDAGQPIAYISANNGLSLRADVPERDAPFIGLVSGASFRTAYSSESHDIADFAGKLTGHPTTATASGGYIPVYFSMKNDGSLISGTYCTVFLRGETRSGVLAVPLEAITEQQGQKFVYIREHSGAYRKQPVVTGQTDGTDIEIVSGLKAGQKVVTRGTTFVRLAETSGVVPEGHKHSH